MECNKGFVSRCLLYVLTMWDFLELRKRYLGIYSHPNGCHGKPAVSTAGLIMIGVNKPFNKAGYFLGEGWHWGTLRFPLSTYCKTCSLKIFRSWPLDHEKPGSFPNILKPEITRLDSKLGGSLNHFWFLCKSTYLEGNHPMFDDWSNSKWVLFNPPTQIFFTNFQIICSVFLLPSRSLT